MGKKPHGHWKDWSVVETRLQELIATHGRFPTYAEMGNALVGGIASYHGGMPAVRQRMGFSSDSKPYGYWTDPENVQRELDAKIAELGRFPTNGEMSSSLSTAVRDHFGDIHALRERMGFVSGQKPEGYWKKLAHVEKEIDALFSQYGRFPKSSEIPSSVRMAIQRYHGGVAVIQKRYGETPLERKPVGHWQDWSNVTAALKVQTVELGRFPSGREIPSGLRTALNDYHGGLAAVREKMGYPSGQKPKGHWQDWNNVKAALGAKIEEFGRFPTGSEMGGSLASAIQKNFGGFIAVRERMGVASSRKPNGHWKKWEHIEAAVEQLIEQHGRFPKGSEMDGSLKSGIQVHHGGIAAVKFRMGHGPAPVVDRKPSGYWQNWENFERELDAAIAHFGHFPSHSELRMFNSSLGSAFGYFGGIAAVCERKGLTPLPERGLVGTWQDWNYVEGVLGGLISKLGHFPTGSEMGGALASAIRRHYGGIAAVRERMGFVDGKKPPGYWKDWDNVREELGAVLEEFGFFPTDSQLRAKGYSSLARAIYGSCFGGVYAVREKMGYPSGQRPSGYWQDWSHVESGLSTLIKKLGRFPKSKEVPSDLLSGIQSHHGGFSAVREKMGYGDSAPQKPNGYWQDLNNVRKELDGLIDKLGHFPSFSELQNYSRALSRALSAYHGGFREVQKLYGILPSKAPLGHWKKWGNVECELGALIEELGYFPTGREIPSGLLGGIESHHGGLLAVKARMGYGDELVALEELVEVLG